MRELLKELSDTLTLKECEIITDTLIALKETIKEGNITDINELIYNIDRFIVVMDLGKICIMDNEKKKRKDKDSD